MTGPDGTIRVLHVEPNDDFAEAVRRDVERADEGIVVETAPTAGDGLDALSGGVDCVVAEYDLPDEDGLELLARVRESHPDLPFVLLTGHGSEAVASRAISSGVTDYLRKREWADRRAALLDRIREAVEGARTREALRETAREATLYERIFHTIQEGACLYDEAGRFEKVNDYLVDFYGTTRESLLGSRSRLVTRLREDGDGDPYRELLDGERDLIQGEYELDVPGRGRAVVDFRLTRVVLDDEVRGVVGVARDITEQKAHERELRQSRAEYQELFNGMNDTAWVIGLDQRFLAVNDAAVDALGYSREELLAMRPQDIDADLTDDEIEDLVTSMPEDEFQVFETVHRTKDGDEIPIEISSSLITYRDETAVLSVARDITLRKEREARLEQFASIVSHDLRNPLNVAQGRVKLAREECDSDHLDPAVRAHERMELLISDLLTLARKGEGSTDPRPASLDDLVRRAWETVAPDDATLDVDVGRTILADESRVQQLLENLVRNAVEHGGRGVTVRVGPLDDGDGFYVEDDGVGIPEADREAVFDVGYSTSERGTGFGLSIVEQVAGEHGWTVEVTEEASGGARFEFTDVAFDG